MILTLRKFNIFFYLDSTIRDKKLINKEIELEYFLLENNLFPDEQIMDNSSYWKSSVLVVSPLCSAMQPNTTRRLFSSDNSSSISQYIIRPPLCCHQSLFINSAAQRRPPFFILLCHFYNVLLCLTLLLPNVHFKMLQDDAIVYQKRKYNWMGLDWNL